MTSTKFRYLLLSVFFITIFLVNITWITRLREDLINKVLNLLDYKRI